MLVCSLLSLPSVKGYTIKYTTTKVKSNTAVTAPDLAKKHHLYVCKVRICLCINIYTQGILYSQKFKKNPSHYKMPTESER